MVTIDSKGLAPSNYKEFYVYYMMKHSNRQCRFMHMWGTVVGSIMTIIGMATLNAMLSAAGLGTAVGVCMISDYTVARIKPLILEHPLWAMRANCEMVAKMITNTQ